MAVFLRMLLAVVLGLVLGSMVNMGLITISGRVIPPPAGVDVTTMRGLQAALPLFEPRHFLFPFLAHALGTLVGACLAMLVAGGRSVIPSWSIGGLFLLGGIANVFLLPAPAWFCAVDIVLAYLPMAWLGMWLARLILHRRQAMAA